MTSNFKKDVLIDVIGVIGAIGYQQTGSGGKKLQLNFVLRDAANNTMNCTIWEDYAKQFFKFNEENATTSGPTVVLLNYAEVKEQVSQRKLCVPFQASSNPPLNNTRAAQLLRMLDRDTFCATVAKTRKIIASSYGWYYRCCHACTKSARGDKPPYECDNRHLTETEIYRECTQILGISAAQMWDTMIQAGITDPLDFSLKLDAMLDLDLALRVRWQPSWDSCSVIMFVDDKPFVKQFSAPWEPTQIKERVDEANTAVADDCDILTDLDITSKHNPDPQTPTAKRQNHDGSSESTTVCDGELSSTKLKKIIKLEKNK
ncbi:uncharacterized protein LOC131662683 [Vicia villosa]|uniref:uncharacterized protein LOC131662683 n=1 Tax=Vicia villosa TaxID=3911 RepID=UPI00273CC293|nr:uncharacterized protein LOC131662683 [Vicia villosa]